MEIVEPRLGAGQEAGGGKVAGGVVVELHPDEVHLDHGVERDGGVRAGALRRGGDVVRSRRVFGELGAEGGGEGGVAGWVVRFVIYGTLVGEISLVWRRVEKCWSSLHVMFKELRTNVETVNDHRAKGPQLRVGSVARAEEVPECLCKGHGLRVTGECGGPDSATKAQQYNFAPGLAR